MDRQLVERLLTAHSRHVSAINAGPGVVLLGRVATRLPVIDVSCNRCVRRGRLHTGRLVAENGAYNPVPVLLRTIAADCPRMQAGQLHQLGFWPSIRSWRFSEQ